MNMLEKQSSRNMISSKISSSHGTEFNLVQVNGTWIRQTGPCQEKDGKSSDAKM